MSLIKTPIKLVCIIDDDEVYLHLIKKIIKLKQLSQNLIIFNNGQEALDYFNTFSSTLTTSEEALFPDIILLDLNMPVMDGWGFLKEYKCTSLSKIQKTTLYIVSSSIDPYEIEKAKSFDSVTDYLIKPISIANFEAIFNRTV